MRGILVSRPIIAVLILTFTYTVTLAVSESDAQTDNSGRNSSEDTALDIDQGLLAVSKRIPTFGGAFFGIDGQLTVWLTEPSSDRARAARSALIDVFGQRYARDELLVNTASYTFDNLHRWRDISIEVLGDDKSVMMFDINETANRVALGISADHERERIAGRLEEAGVPRDALDFFQTNMVEMALRARHRPMVGGLQVQFQSGAFGALASTCTMGFTALRAGADGFVTNSHCTRVRGELDNGRYWQPTRPVLDTDQVGFETVDPPFFTGGTCPAGRRCRRSDSAYIQASQSINRGRLARVPAGTLAWDGVSTYRIVTKAPLAMNDIAAKVGRTTGLSSGPVTHTCVTTNVADSDITMLCQDIARANADSGDSGSPMFRITNALAPHDINLAGLLWGIVDINGERHFVASNINHVEQELGSMLVCPNAFNC